MDTLSRHGTVDGVFGTDLEVDGEKPYTHGGRWTCTPTQRGTSVRVGGSDTFYVSVRGLETEHSWKIPYSIRPYQGPGSRWVLIFLGSEYRCLRRTGPLKEEARTAR